MLSHAAVISGTVVADNGQPVDYASVVFAGTSMGCFTDADGRFSMEAPAGNYQLHVSSLGFRKNESKVSLSDSNPLAVEVVLASETQVLDEVEVVSNVVSRVQRSAFNAVGLDTKVMENTSQNLSDLLSQAPGMKLRESGGVGSDMQLMMDGFSGKHIKVFIDGVPQEGVGSSFSLNNIPVNFAERMEWFPSGSVRMPLAVSSISLRKKARTAGFWMLPILTVRLIPTSRLLISGIHSRMD